MSDQILTAGWLTEVPTEKPKPLLLDYLDPEQHTVLFGDGGTGKGIIAAWWIAALTRDGYAVVILDYEQNARWEWRPRIEGFEGKIDRVRIVQPDVAVWDAREAIAAEIEVVRAKYPKAPIYLVVDSVAYACMGANIESSDVAVEYKHEVDFHGLPTLSLAHTTKANADPEHPFGSTFWSNGARLTIGIARESKALDSPRILRNKKTNQRGPFAPTLFPWDWVNSGLPKTLEPRVYDESLADRAHTAVYMKGWMTLAEIAGAVSADGGKPFTERGMADAIAADPRFEADGTGGRGKVRRWKAGVIVKRSGSSSNSTPAGTP